MAMHLNAGDVGRSDLFHVYPANIVVNEALNGRRQPHATEEVEELAQSILMHGQQQPVKVRRLPDKRVELVHGYRRWKAVNLINTNLRPKEPIKLACTVTDMNDEESFVANIVENHHRKDCSDIDNAHNHRRLREEYGYDDGKIGEIYQRQAAWVNRLRDLLTLPGAVQAKVNKGDLAVNAALDLATLPADEQAETLKNATGKNGKVSTKVIAGKVREKKIAEGGRKSRTLSEVKAFLDKFTGDDTGDSLKSLANALLDFFAGKTSEKTMENRLSKLFKEEGAK